MKAGHRDVLHTKIITRLGPVAERTVSRVDWCMRLGEWLGIEFRRLECGMCPGSSEGRVMTLKACWQRGKMFDPGKT